MANKNNVDFSSLFKKLQLKFLIKFRESHKIINALPVHLECSFNNITSVVIDTKGLLYDEDDYIICVREAFVDTKNYLALLYYSKDTGEINQLLYSVSRSGIILEEGDTTLSISKEIVEETLLKVSESKELLAEQKRIEYQAYDRTQEPKPIITGNPQNKKLKEYRESTEKAPKYKKENMLKSFTPTLRMLPHHFVASKKAVEYAESLGIELMEGFTIVKH